MTIWDTIEKAGTSNGGWTYDEDNLEYDQLIDPDSGNKVYYNGVGTSVAWTNIPKTISLLLILFI
jgi:hypothetical protein